jgi:hypothetical protein
MRQVVTLGDLVGRLERLTIRCRCGERPALIRLTRLLEAHGAGMALPELGLRRAADCPEQQRPTCRSGAASPPRFGCARREPGGTIGHSARERITEAAPYPRWG